MNTPRHCPRGQGCICQVWQPLPSADYGLHRILTGLTTAPAHGTASKNSWKRSEFSDSMPTRSPPPTPAERSAPASRAIRSADSATVRTRPLHMVSGRSGSCYKRRCSAWVTCITTSDGK